MSAVLVSKENNKAVFTVEIPQEDFEKSIQGIYIKNKKYFSIPGFRKGKAPRKLIEANYGEEVFYEDALNDVLPEAYEKAVADLELDPIDQPHIDVGDIAKGKDIQVKFEVDLKPIPVLGDYKTMELEEILYEVKEEQIDTEIQQALENNARMVTVEDGEAKLGDTVNIDYEGLKDGVAFEGGTAQGHDLELGSGSFIPGFEEQLMGGKTGEEVEVKVTFPEDYHSEDLKGADAVFNVKINSITEKVLPELDDEFAKDVSEFDTLEEYKGDIRSRLEKEMEERKKIDTENRALEKLIEISEISAPESMIRHQVEHEVEDFGRQLQQMGLDLQSYYQFSQGNEETLKEQLKPQAEKKVLAELALDALVQAEEVQVDDEAVNEELKKLAEAYKAEDIDKFMEQMKESNGVEYVKDSLKKQKAMENLVSYVTFVERLEEAAETESEDTVENSTDEEAAKEE